MVVVKIIGLERTIHWRLISLNSGKLKNEATWESQNLTKTNLFISSSCWFKFVSLPRVTHTRYFILETNNYMKTRKTPIKTKITYIYRSHQQNMYSLYLLMSAFSSWTHIKFLRNRLFTRSSIVFLWKWHQKTQDYSTKRIIWRVPMKSCPMFTLCDTFVTHTQYSFKYSINIRSRYQ